jgi:hypothetical protein
MKNNVSLGLMKQFIWAYPQVMFDSITIDTTQAPNGFIKTIDISNRGIGNKTR